MIYVWGRYIFSNFFWVIVDGTQHFYFFYLRQFLAVYFQLSLLGTNYPLTKEGIKAVYSKRSFSKDYIDFQNFTQTQREFDGDFGVFDEKSKIQKDPLSGAKRCSHIKAVTQKILHYVQSDPKFPAAFKDIKGQNLFDYSSYTFYPRFTFHVSFMVYIRRYDWRSNCWIFEKSCLYIALEKRSNSIDRSEMTGWLLLFLQPLIYDSSIFTIYI